MSGVVAYLERQAGGLLITRARLLGDGWSGEWKPAPTPAPEGAPGELSGADAALTQARAAGAWIVQQLDLRRLRAIESLVVDGDGAVCLWLGAPSADPAVIAAALLQGGSRADDGATGAGDAVMFAAVEGAGIERSIQAAAAPEGAAAPARRSLLSRSNSAVAPDPVRQRIAVMSVPDASIRVVLDELDAAGIAVDSVTSLWHAAARAWDPEAADSDAAARASSRVAAEAEASLSAVVLVDPIGRLLWCWTRAGRMLAGGSMLLRRVEVGGAVASLLELDGADGSPADSLAAVECSEAEASRLCVDWLGWSAQLGVSPGRIVYVGPPAADGGAGRAFAQAIAERWPGAFVDAATDDDPIGLTLSRARTSVPWQDQDAAVDDGQRALVELSQRPGRQHRSYYRWLAGAIAAVALLVAAAGWKMRVAAADAQGQLDAMSAERADALKKLEGRIPALSSMTNMSDPVGRIRGYINDLRTRSDKIRPEVPLMNEFQRLLMALNNEPGVKLDVISLSPITPTVKLIVPDADAGPRLTARLNALPGEIDWTGASGGLTGGSGRTWTITGRWSDKKPAGGGGGGGQ